MRLTQSAGRHEVTMKRVVGLLSALGVLTTALPAQEPEFKDLPALLASLPEATVAPLDAASSLVFTALPLACVDDLQAKPGATRPYFWQPTYKTIDAYDKNRAFYGCTDWPTAVGATYTMVSLLKRYPDLATGQLIREKLTDHLGRQNLEGELAYFKAAGNAQRPYGYVWFLKLYGELVTWKDPDGTRYAENVTPLARFFADGMVSYLIDLERPNRMAGQTNSALMLGLLLDYVDATRDMTLKRAASDTARRLFESDKNCTTKDEAASPEMVSPCLAEASVMSRVLEPAAFAAWFDAFMPAAFSADFKPLRSISFDSTGTGRRGGGRGANAGAGRGNAQPPTEPPSTARGNAQTPPPDPNAPARGGADAAGAGRAGGPAPNPRVQWIGLAFTRADALTRIAAALPPTDARVAVFRRLAAMHASQGQQELKNPGAFDAPWVGALAVSYLLSTGGSR